MSPTIWFKPGIFIVYGASLDAGVHKHHSIQLVWPSADSQCQLDERDLNGAIVIDSQVEHQLRMDSGWILLVEPQSDLGLSLSQHLRERSIASLDCLAPDSKPISGDNNPLPYLEPLLTKFDLPLALNRSEIAVTDQRIEQLIAWLNLRSGEHGLSPADWKASVVAEQLDLSEGRFLHLFREQVGIAWRPYLIWRRTITAIGLILQGSSATDAAHFAGFSDSAHLSRSFRGLFGMTIRQSQSLFSNANPTKRPSPQIKSP